MTAAICPGSRTQVTHTTALSGLCPKCGEYVNVDYFGTIFDHELPQPNRYACGCGEGRLTPGWHGGDHGTMPILYCNAYCGEVIEPDPDYPGADAEWRAAALEMCPPDTDPEDGAGESDTVDETPEENLARITAELGFTPLPAGPPPRSNP
jgi:hypothetical protein